MRKSLLVSVALGVLFAVTVAGVASSKVPTGKPVKVIANGIELTANGGFSPKVLSKTKPTPIALGLEGQIRMLDGSHPPALKEVVIESDKNAAFNAKGYPVCKPGPIQATTTAQALKNCGTALIGEGKTEIEIFFEESKQIPVQSRLLVFNGGVRGATTTLLIHAYITFPVPAAVVTTVKIHKGPHGLVSVASIPKIAGGSGSVKSFSLEIKKNLHYKGKTFHILTLKCPTGKVQVHATAVFADAAKTRMSADVVRPCTGKK